MPAPPAPSPPRRVLSRTALAGTTAVACFGLLSGCSTLSVVTAVTRPAEAAIFRDLADAEKNATGVELPSWLPDDAENIRIKVRTDGSGAIMMFDSAGIDNSECTTKEVVRVPHLRDSWWPEHLPGHAIGCERWGTVSDRGHVYAWTSHDVRVAVDSRRR
ncbi:hypothetical protein [Luethyella okanaganae]|uniref:Lipoprotein n=1 Tax=Luethyella okanaganae TaxID=69372 RepID=A0ABW1VGD3_9MICO